MGLNFDKVLYIYRLKFKLYISIGIWNFKNIGIYFKIIVTHLKPPTKNILTLKEQIKNQNDLGLQIIYPEQGKRFEL